MADVIELYTKRPTAVSRLLVGEIFEPIRHGRIRLQAQLCDVAEFAHFERVNAKPTHRSDTIYFIEAIGTGFVKVGICTDDPMSRLAVLQTGCPFELRLIAAMPGDRRMEARIHRRLTHDRGRGEWFQHTPDLDHIITWGCE